MQLSDQCIEGCDVDIKELKIYEYICKTYLPSFTLPVYVLLKYLTKVFFKWPKQHSH